METATPSAIPTPPVSSFLTRAANVFAAPGELYAEVAGAPPQSTSWLIPYLTSMLVGLVFTVALFNNPALRQEIFDSQQQEMEKAVAEGKMTQEQADRATEGMESVGPAMFIVIGGVSAMFFISAAYFGVSLLLWLAAKFILKFNGSYKKILESYALSGLIGILGAIVTLLMMNFLDTMKAGPSAAMLVLGSYDKDNFTHNLLASLNVFTIWQTSVVGLALTKLTGKSIGMGMGVSFGLWLVWALCASALGWGMR